MASQPPAQPDVIEPESPQEMPAQPSPDEAPPSQPDEVAPPRPDVIEPGRGPGEVTPPV